MWKAIPDMDLGEVKAASKANARELRRLRVKLDEGGRNVGATRAAFDRRRTKTVELCDRERELRGWTAAA